MKGSTKNTGWRSPRLAWAASLFLLGHALAAVGQTETADPIDGAALYGRYCASCHGRDARGEPSMKEAFLAPPPDLTRIAERRGGWFPEVLVREFIDGRFAVHGTRTMPVWGRTLDEAQLIALTEHLFALQVQTESAPGMP